MTNNLIADWILIEIDALTKENAELLECTPVMHPHPAAMSNMYRLGKSDACRAKIDAYIKLLDYLESIK
jgi:hypothetical protein